MEEEKLHGAILRAINQFVERQTVENAALGLLETIMGSKRENGQSIADLQNEVAEISAKQQRLLDAILQDMDNTELGGRLKALTDRKRELNQMIDQKREELSTSESDHLRIQGLRDWITENRVGISTYDDKVTRRLVERITVVDKGHISVQFVGEDESVEVEL